MPIIDIQLILPAGVGLAPELAKELADKLGHVLNVKAGQLWLRLQALPSSNCAQNAPLANDTGLPVFVTVLHAQPQEGDKRQAEAHAVAQVVANAMGRPRTQVHIEYAAPGAGRMGFGGNLVH